jgi:transglutaminase-like putative cysteine protease
MQLEAAFRRSLYLSLAIASLALCVAEGSFLPEMPIVGGLVGTLLLVAYFLEGRWSLSLSAANSVGMVLTALLGIWIAYQFFRPSSESLIYQLPWPTSLLPYLGPVLLILIPVKLFRPKEINDYWAMYGLGLMAMALGCAMAEEGLFGILLMLWLVIFVWSLTLFYLYRESGKQPRLLMGSRPETEQQRGRFPLVRRSGRWTLGVMLVGLVFFMATPRFAVPFQWRARMETGLTADSHVDLRQTGNLNVNEELAFTVEAEDRDGNPKTDIFPAARWRHKSLVNYKDGQWLKERSGANLSLDTVCRPLAFNEPNRSRDAEKSSPRLARLPDLGPKQIFLQFRPAPEQSPLPLLADPPFWRHGELAPIVSPVNFDPETWVNWQQAYDTSFNRIQAMGRMMPIWCETRVDELEPDLGPTMYLIDNNIPKQYTDYSATPNLLKWTDNVVEKLINEGKLSPRVRDRAPGEGRRKREHHEAIARALNRYLANSGEFEYTLDLRRKDRRIDPIEDFLYNTKSGHCQRYATALVFMLRTQGIPAQFVLGYKGCEEPEPGKYLIRQSHAHTWVEVLITRAPLPDFPPPTREQHRIDSKEVLHYHWLSLDPTPDLGADDSVASNTNWIESAGNKTTAFFRQIILGFNNEIRQRFGQAVADFFARAGDAIADGRISIEVLIIVGVLSSPILFFVIRSYRRRKRPAPDTESEAALLARVAPFHARLLKILEAAGFRPMPSETAREFALAVEIDLAKQPHTASVARVPLEAADLYYRVRFGNQTVTSEELTRLEKSLDELEGNISRNAN